VRCVGALWTIEEAVVCPCMGLLFVGVEHRRLLTVRVGDDYVDIISLFTLELESTTNDGHHSPVGSHSVSSLESEFARLIKAPSHDFVLSQLPKLSCLLTNSQSMIEVLYRCIL